MKRTKFFKMALTVALILCLSCTAMVFAEGEVTGGTEAAPLQAAIKKVLQMPEGTITPAAEFTFSIDLESVDGDDTATAPAIADKTVTFASTDTGATANGVKTVTKETANIFAGITWPHAGIYVYTITEDLDTSTNTGETMTYSGAEYQMTVYVANGVNAPFVTAIVTKVVAVDNADQTIGDKVDPTPESSEMVFTNTFIKTNGTSTSGALMISKTVTGIYGNMTMYFPFTLTVTSTALEATGATYKVYVLESGAVVDATTANVAVASIKNDGTNDYIEVVAGTQITINLKHGQTLSFADLPVGAKYTVTEAAATDYTPSVSVVVNGGTASVTNGTKNEALTVETKTIGEGANSAAFTNAHAVVSPTGILVDNLPFITIIALAVIAFIIFIVTKSRRRAHS